MLLVVSVLSSTILNPENNFKHPYQLEFHPWFPVPARHTDAAGTTERGLPKFKPGKPFVHCLKHCLPLQELAGLGVESSTACA